MTYDIRKLEKEHLLDLLWDEINEDEKEWLSEKMINELIKQDFQISVFYKGILMACGGVQPYWYNRASVWTMFSGRAGDNFLPVFRAIKWFLNYQPFKRVEISVPCDFELGKRRALMLGFNLECGRAKHFLPDGRDVSLYSYIRKE